MCQSKSGLSLNGRRWVLSALHAYSGKIPSCHRLSGSMMNSGGIAGVLIRASGSSQSILI